MSKRKSIILLSIISVIMAFLLVMTFARFPIGANKDYISALGAIKLDYDMDGGTAYTLTLEESSDPVEDIDEVIDTLQYRLNALGYKNSVVKAIKNTDSAVQDYRIRIETRGVNNEYGKHDVASLSTDMNVVIAYGELKFYGGTETDPDTEIFTNLSNPIKKVEYLGAVNDGSSAYYPVSVTFTDKAYDELIANVRAGSYYLKVMIGDTKLDLFGSEALTESIFDGKSISVYATSEAYAKQVVLQVQSGGLAYKYRIDSTEDIASLYGENVKLISVLAVAAVMIAVIVALCIIFKGLGVAYALTMICFMLLEVWMLVAIPGIKLSLGGVIGIVVATVLTADTFIMSAKRIQEEFSRGKTVKAAISTGYKRALLPTISTCVTVGFVALMLFAFTTAQLSGFAITLGIGAVIALICGLLLSRMFTYLILPLVKSKEKFLGVNPVKKEEA